MTGDYGCVYTTDVSLDKDGYPRIKHNKRMWRLNRFVYTLVHGEIPNGNVIGHLCNNKGCINPHHLYLTTASENSTHAKLDGLYRTGYKSDHIKKLDDDWLNVCRLYHEEGLSQQAIADIYSVQQPRVSQLIRSNKKRYEDMFSQSVV